MSEEGIYFENFYFGGDSANTENIKNQLSGDQAFETYRMRDGGLYVRTYGIELELGEEGLIAEVAPHLRERKTAKELTELLSEEYEINAEVLLGDGFGAGG